MTAPKFNVGARVCSKWGNATVIAVYDREEYGDDDQAYRIKHDWSTSPPNFGHTFYESELGPAFDGGEHEMEGENLGAPQQRELFA